MEVEEEGDYIYLSLHCHHQNDSCIKMGRDESHFNVSLIVRDNVTRLSTDHNLKRIQTEVSLRLTARPNRLTDSFNRFPPLIAFL